MQNVNYLLLFLDYVNRRNRRYLKYVKMYLNVSRDISTIFICWQDLKHILPFVFGLFLKYIKCKYPLYLGIKSHSTRGRFSCMSLKLSNHKQLFASMKSLIGRGLLIGAAIAKLHTAGDLITVLPQ